MMIDEASRGRREHSIETARIDRAQANRVCALSDKIACRRLRCLVRICSDLTLNVRARPEQGSNRTERIESSRLSHGVAGYVIRSAQVLRCESIANSPFVPISQSIE